MEEMNKIEEEVTEEEKIEAEAEPETVEAEAPEEEAQESERKEIPDVFKKLVAAGVGAATATVEKTTDLVNGLIEKGEAVLNQNESDTREKRNDSNIKERLNEAGGIAKAAGEKAKGAIRETAERFSPEHAFKDVDLSGKIEHLSLDELKELKEKIVKKIEEAENVLEQEYACEAAAAEAMEDLKKDDQAEEAPAEEAPAEGGAEA